MVPWFPSHVSATLLSNPVLQFASVWMHYAIFYLSWPSKCHFCCFSWQQQSTHTLGQSCDVLVSQKSSLAISFITLWLNVPHRHSQDKPHWMNSIKEIIALHNYCLVTWEFPSVICQLWGHEPCRPYSQPQLQKRIHGRHRVIVYYFMEQEIKT